MFWVSLSAEDLQSGTEVIVQYIKSPEEGEMSFEERDCAEQNKRWTDASTQMECVQ